MKIVIALIIYLFTMHGNAELPLEIWLQAQEKISIQRMMQNISPSGTIPGTVIASPSKNSPNYYFHWIRDASLTFDQVVTLFKNSKDVDQRNFYLHRIQEFIQLSQKQQFAPGAEGLGEPRYLVDGSADTIAWSRPQSDGPALRALTLLNFLKILSDNKPLRLETEIVIHTDLDYIADHWSRPCFDLWEEVKGLHFYTQSVQAASLWAGYDYFKNTQDTEFAKKLKSAALAVDQELLKYWDREKKIIDASRDLTHLPNSQYKYSNLDSAVILAALHSYAFDEDRYRLSEPSIRRDYFLPTALALELVFTQIYDINLGSNAPAIGRFADDVYFAGNPWYMTTAAFAEFYFRVATVIKKSEFIQINELNIDFFQNALSKYHGQEPSLHLTADQNIAVQSATGRRLLASLYYRGNSFLETLRRYTGSQGEMSEQFDRRAGVPVSAPDLTWSYAGFLSALQARAVFLSSGMSSLPKPIFLLQD